MQTEVEPVGVFGSHTLCGFRDRLHLPPFKMSKHPASREWFLEIVTVLGHIYQEGNWQKTLSQPKIKVFTLALERQEISRNVRVLLPRFITATKDSAMY